MPRRCTVCEHEKVEEINRLLLEGVSLRDLAGRYSVSKTALHRHKESHLPAKLVKAREAREIAKADSLLDQVIELRDKALSILDKAEQAGDLRTALQGVREAKGCLELLARLQRELQEQATVNVNMRYEYDITHRIEQYADVYRRLARRGVFRGSDEGDDTGEPLDTA